MYTDEIAGSVDISDLTFGQALPFVLRSRNIGPRELDCSRWEVHEGAKHDLAVFISAVLQRISHCANIPELAVDNVVLSRGDPVRKIKVQRRS